MAELPDLIEAYCQILNEEDRLRERKEKLRREILTEMDRMSVADVRYPQGHAERGRRFKLLPKRDAVLALLERDDLFPFATFTPAKVKDVLVPKYGRERLLPLFDVQKSDMLVIKRPHGPSGPHRE